MVDKTTGEILCQILKNQMKLADMIANPLRLRPEQLQDEANRLAVESQRVVNSLELSENGDGGLK